ncbi:exonuclease mut-7 homolog [Saccoglossus kowalevskii]|uniref:Probable exonuclease mut-7 homolog n=1 Tax=Saccoglossus kowalevskii TaxID=10224 RepID=A0ABM0LZQ2_SACKO|nr:PREDICTED: probable exonuclease mut-7 homolog [Saccoglossus kowalevskii]
MITLGHLVYIVLARTWKILTGQNAVEQHLAANIIKENPGGQLLNEEDTKRDCILLSRATSSNNTDARRQKHALKSAERTNNSTLSKNVLHKQEENYEPNQETSKKRTTEGARHSTISNDEYQSAAEDVDLDTIDWCSLSGDKFLVKLEMLWLSDKKNTVPSVLRKKFRSIEDPHGFVLYLLRASKLLTADVKLQALKAGNNVFSSVFDTIVKVYELDSPGNECLLPYINQLLHKHHYKEAANCVSKLNLQHCFTLNEIVLPLIYQDKGNMVERYLHGHKDLQIELVKLLDSYCDKDFDLNGIIANCRVPLLRKDKLRPRHLCKLVMRLVKLYKLDGSLCPNVTNVKNMSGIKFLLYKKYIEKSMVSDSWNELVENAVSGNPWLQEQLVDHIVSYNDIDAAAYWAMLYNVPDERLHSRVTEAIAAKSKEVLVDATGDKPEDCDEKVNCEDLVKYHQLLFPVEHIQMVDSEDGLNKCAEILFKPGAIIGIDSEWRPAFGPICEPVKVSLLQLASIDAVFILDMMTLSQCVDVDILKDFMLKLFTTHDILKLGYGIDGDIKMLFKSYPLMRNAADLQRIVDLSVLTRNIQKESPELLQNSSTTEDASGEGSGKKGKEKGLSELVQRCLGKPLNKMERLSDWERRPLRQAQLIYAALDAYCLLEVYDHIRNKVKESGLDINLEPPLPKKTPKVKKSKPDGGSEGGGSTDNSGVVKASRAPQRPVMLHHQPTGPSISPSEFHVVCDTMLQGLGRQLRCCGVDVRILDNTEEHDKAAEIARREGRVILTSGMPYQTLRSQVGEGMCFCVSNRKAKHQVKEVLRHFNVYVAARDIFSRCQVCNGNQYITIPVDTMKQAIAQKRKAKDVDVDGDRLNEQQSLELELIEGTEKAYDIQRKDRAIEETGAGYVSPEIVAKGNRQEKADVDLVTMGADLQSDVAKENVTPFKLSYGIIKTGPNEGEGGILEEEEDDDDDEEGGDNTNSEVLLMNRPARPPYQPQFCRSAESMMINTDNWTLESGVEIQVDRVPEGICDKVEVFYSCASCGKVFWEGRHYVRVFDQFEHVLHKDD